MTSSISRDVAAGSQTSSGRKEADVGGASRVERVCNISQHRDMYDEDVESSNSSDDEREFDRLGETDEIYDSDPGKNTISYTLLLFQ